MRFKCVFLQELGLKLREVLLTLEPLNALVLIVFDPVHLVPNSGLLGFNLLFFPLFFRLAEILIDTLVKRVKLKIEVICMLSEQKVGNKVLYKFALVLFDNFRRLNDGAFLCLLHFFFFVNDIAFDFV